MKNKVQFPPIRVSKEFADSINDLASVRGEKSVTELIRNLLVEAIQAQREQDRLAAMEYRIIDKISNLEKLIVR